MTTKYFFWVRTKGKNGVSEQRVSSPPFGKTTFDRLANRYPELNDIVRNGGCVLEIKRETARRILSATIEVRRTHARKRLSEMRFTDETYREIERGFREELEKLRAFMVRTLKLEPLPI
jgi:hypothetical protein